jgi:hypothetical protein
VAHVGDRRDASRVLLGVDLSGKDQLEDLSVYMGG